MLFTDNFTLACPIDDAWELLTDSERMRNCVPGLDKSTVREIGADQYTGVIKITIARIPASFSVQARITESVPPKRLVAMMTGKDRFLGSNLTASSVLELQEEDAESTRVHYSVDMNVTGKVATFGYPVILSKSKEFSIQFIKALRQQVVGIQAQG